MLIKYNTDIFSLPLTENNTTNVYAFKKSELSSWSSAKDDDEVTCYIITNNGTIDESEPKKILKKNLEHHLVKNI